MINAKHIGVSMIRPFQRDNSFIRNRIFLADNYDGIIGGIKRSALESPVPPPVLAGSGSTGLLFEHLRRHHPAGS